MKKLVIKVEVDGKEEAKFEFDCSSVTLPPQKLQGGPITLHFTPDGDYYHQMEINSLPPARSKSIK
ncbi:MAG TPA: hypothetical protein VFE62_13530 [Gemmataceae bacterium]|nr:hypothetical protein [Gemmataceae bacterium]